MSNQHCCRTCLNTSNLNPIFYDLNKCDEYTHILKLTTGLMIRMNDNLPQVMCTDCINIINKHIQFLQKCYITQLVIKNRIINSKNIAVIKQHGEGYIKNGDASLNVYSPEKKKANGNECENGNTLNNMSNCNLNRNNNDSLNKYEITVEDLLKKRLDVKFEDFVPRQKVKLEYDETKANIHTQKSDEKMGLLQCKYCKKVLKSKNSLSSHYKTHFGPVIVCEHCGKKFMSKRHLLMHCKSKHGYEKTDKCAYCEYRGSNPELVKIHERIHTGERPYVCARCGAAFHRRSTYLQHTPIHLPEKTVPCPDCPALFKSITLMRIHRSRHKRRAARDSARHCSTTNRETIK